MQLRCAVITMAPFPKGNVSTVRYTSYLKSLVKEKCHTFVLIYCPTRMAAHINNRFGIYEGINYQYATKPTWGKYYNILIKGLYLIIGLLSSIKYIYNHKINTIVLYGDNPAIVTIFYWLVCKILDIKYIGDRSEYPNIQVRNSKFRMFFFKIQMSLFDGLIIMTKELVQFYKKCSKKENYIFLLPMTIDRHRFDSAKIKPQQQPYIAVVFGIHNRDGLYESLMSYSLYCKEYGGKYDMVLIGDYDNMPNKEILDLVINDDSLKNRIQVLGKVDIDEVPQILINASCLLTTPNSYISGGFPTKLGEYMLSGVPVVATNAGEISDYVEDRNEVILVPVGDIDSIAEQILFVEQHPSEVKIMAENAKRKVCTTFSADTYVNNLIRFLQ